MDAKYNQHFDEYLNEECLNDNYSIPTSWRGNQFHLER